MAIISQWRLIETIIYWLWKRVAQASWFRSYRRIISSHKKKRSIWNNRQRSQVHQISMPPLTKIIITSIITFIRPLLDKTWFSSKTIIKFHQQMQQGYYKVFSLNLILAEWRQAQPSLISVVVLDKDKQRNNVLHNSKMLPQAILLQQVHRVWKVPLRRQMRMRTLLRQTDSQSVNRVDHLASTIQRLTRLIIRIAVQRRQTPPIQRTRIQRIQIHHSRQHRPHKQPRRPLQLNSRWWNSTKTSTRL